MNNNPSRQELLHFINVASFSVDDAKLFLDTHPENREALAYFNEYSNMRNQALTEYARLYGPLTIDTASASSCDYWKWINEPWPWQEGGC